MHSSVADDGLMSGRAGVDVWEGWEYDRGGLWRVESDRREEREYCEEKEEKEVKDWQDEYGPELAGASRKKLFGSIRSGLVMMVVRWLAERCRYEAWLPGFGLQWLCVAQQLSRTR